MNTCQFSPDRRYRYTLEHRWDDLLPAEPRRIMWVGLNPSTADEQQLDPTLRRIRGFSQAWGFTSFVMTNLFAFRATDPAVMKRAKDPVGPLNDILLKTTAASCEIVVACWGMHGRHLGRAAQVERLMREHGRVLQCLGTTSAGDPRHPLYVRASAALRPF